MTSTVRGTTANEGAVTEGKEEAQIYSESWYSACHEGSTTAARIYVEYLWNLIRPWSVLDVGCGRGEWLSAWRAKGVQRSLGLDGPWNRREQMIDADVEYAATDLSEPFNVGEKFDLCMTLEVAEHLPVRSAEGFVTSIAETSDLILFGAAYSEQGGRGHLNERPATYWAQQLGLHGFAPFDLLRPTFWADERIPFWYRQNTFLYARRGARPFADLVSRGVAPLEHIGFMDCVHPDLYRCKIADIAAALASGLRPK